MRPKYPLLDAKIRTATHQLGDLGKTPADATTLIRNMTRSLARGRKPYNFAAAGWQRNQVWAALELSYLVGFRELLALASISPGTFLTLALDYADAPVLGAKPE